jgi:uncharacterized phage protein (TIGR01671 family)
MRQILFRGKKIDNGEWTYGFYFEHSIYGQKHSYIKYQTFDEGFVTDEVDAETVGQFTGLCDKNGRKIFEGDIVKVTIGVKGYRTTYDSVNCTVEFRSDNCGIAVFYPFTNSNIIETEVVGNIYDNKEEEE